MATYDFSTTANPLPSPWGTGTGWANLQATGGQGANAALADSDSMMRYTLSNSVRSIIEYRSGTFDGGAAFMDAAGNGYVVTFYTGTTGELYKVTGGPSYGLLGSNFTASFVAGDIQETRLEGNDIVVYKNSVEIARRTDSTFRAGLNPAIFMFAGDLRVDNWSDGLIASAGDTLWYPQIPGPGFAPSPRVYFLPPRYLAAVSMPNDTSLQASLSSESSFTADLTAIGKTGLMLGSGPGISPDYLFLFNPQRFSASFPPNDTSLQAALSSQSTATAALTTAIPLQASLASVSAMAAALTTAIPLQASLQSQCALTSALSTQIALSSALASVSTLNGALTTSITLASVLQSQCTASAALTTAIPLQSALSSVSTLTAALSTQITLAASLVSQSTLTATLAGTAIPLNAALSSVSTLTAALSTQIRLAAGLQSQSTLAADISTQIRLASTLQSVCTLTGTLSGTAAQLTASLNSQSSLTATLGNANTPIQASLLSQSTLTASLSTAITPAAQLQSISTLTATLTGGAAALAATLQGLSQIVAELTSTVRPQPSGMGFYDAREGQFASIRVPYVTMAAGPSRLVAGESYGVAIGRFAWADDDGIVRTIRTGDQRLGFVRQVFGPYRAIYQANGLRWIRRGLPVTLYIQGEFWARFVGGAYPTDRVYVSLLDGSPVSGYAPNTLPTPWRVAVGADPGELAVISTWEN